MSVPLIDIYEDSPPVILRPYQERMVSAWEAFLDRGGRRGLIVAATGSGKTTVFASIIRKMAQDPAFAALVIAHRHELLEQACDRIRLMNRGLSCAIDSGRSEAPRGTSVVVASVQAIGTATTKRLDWLGPNLVICDESHHACFAPGTLVDGRPIETIEVGDFVRSFNHALHRTIPKRVTRIWRTKALRLWRVRFTNGETLLVTPDHPFWMKVNEQKEMYRPLSSLGGDTIFYHATQKQEGTIIDGELHKAKGLRRVRSDVSAEQLEQQDDADLLRRMQVGSQKGARKNRAFKLRELRIDSGMSGPRTLVQFGSIETRSGLLFDSLQGRVRFEDERGTNGGNESQIRIEADERPQPDEIRCEPREDEQHASRNRAQAEDTRGQRRADGPSEVTCRSSRVANGGPGFHDASQKPVSECSAHLQNRYCESRSKDRNRGRWPKPSKPQESGRRSIEGCSLGELRVASIEVLQRGSDGTFGGLCPDGVVYNLEVETHHNYFVGESGILVHNCAVTYQNCFRRFGCYDDDGGTALLGVTATPHRLDNKALFDQMGSKRAIFEDIIFSYDIVAAIKDGFLVDLRGYRAAAELNLDHVKKTAGDYNQAQLEKVVNTHPVNELAFKSWDEVASNRRTIVFCAGVDHAKDVAALFVDKGVTAEAVWGDMHQQEREQVIRRFRSGKTQVLCNRDIATEGFDVPEAACILLLRPTQSWSLFTQMVGRGLRVLPGIIEGIGEPSSRRHAIGGSEKPDCIVIDIVDNIGMHSVTERPDDGTVPSLQALVGLPSALDLEGRTLAEAVEEFEELPDMVKAAAFRRPTSFSGLSAKLTQVEMLSEVEMPQEAIGAGANLYWIKTGDGRYVIDCGRGAEETMSRTAALEVDIIGNWTLTLKSQTRNEVYPMPSTMEEAFISAEATIRKYFFGVTQIAGRNAAWRKGAPTDKQVQLLVRLGMDRALVHEMIRDGTMDKGKASSMITLLQTNGGSNA